MDTSDQKHKLIIFVCMFLKKINTCTSKKPVQDGETQTLRKEFIGKTAKIQYIHLRTKNI